MVGSLHHPSLPPKPTSISSSFALRSDVTGSGIHRVMSGGVTLLPTDDTAGIMAHKAENGDKAGNDTLLKRKVDQTDLAIEASQTSLDANSKSSDEGPKQKVIPILPTPLPSKRFKKGAQIRSLLIPVEQLPVYALPTLPVIMDPALERQVFQHQSMFPKVRGAFEDPEDQPGMHYEKLEHVGDSILGMIVTTWLQETKPLLTCGTASVSSCEQHFR